MKLAANSLQIPAHSELTPAQVRETKKKFAKLSLAVNKILLTVQEFGYNACFRLMLLLMFTHSPKTVTQVLCSRANTSCPLGDGHNRSFWQ